MSLFPRIPSLARPLLAVALLAAPASPQIDLVRAEQKIGNTMGGLGNVLDPQDYLGFGMAALGDLDGDGVGDLAVGAPGDDDGGYGQGAVWILFLNADGTVGSTQKISETSGGFGGTLQLGDGFGYGVAALGDVNGDGVGDLAVSTDGSFGGFQGEVWILFLNPDGTVSGQQRIAEGIGGFGGSLEPDDRFGIGLCGIGDLDGDGIEDLAVGAFRDDDVLPDQGSVWILFLNADGTVRTEQQISASSGGFTGNLGTDGFGISLARLGDLDGDGIGELAVGAYTDDDDPTHPGAVWILFLNADGTVRTHQKINTTEGGFTGAPANQFGSGVAAPGDLDRDGVADLAVGAYAGAEVWVLYLNRDGTVASSRAISETAGGFEGQVAGSSFGLALASPGDLDGDGGGDLFVGAPFDGDGGVDSGAVWTLFLREHVRLELDTEDDFATALVNGQDISTPPEFGRLVAISSSGPNAGAAIFDSTPGGPNDPSQDPDLLVDSGNLLILQTDRNTSQTTPGVFDRPNDDEDGGRLTLSFLEPVEPSHVDLVDIDSGMNEASTLVLTDAGGRTRTFTIPAGWTGDLLVDGVGRRTLDLATLEPQPGLASTVTAFQEPGFSSSHVVSLELHLGSSGALDEPVWLTRPPMVDGPRVRRAARPGAGSL